MLVNQMNEGFTKKMLEEAWKGKSIVLFCGDRPALEVIGLS